MSGFSQKTACLVDLIVTLRIWVETDPGHDFWSKLPKVCQDDLDLEDGALFMEIFERKVSLKLCF